MKRTVTDQVLRRIRAKRRAWVFTAKDFVDMGSREAVDQTLHRLEEQGIIQRLDRGIYYFPLENEHKPAQTPEHMDAIARAIAAQTGDRAMLTGEEAAERLGLIPASGKVRAIHEYLITGRSKQRTVGKKTLQFRHTAFTPPDIVPDAPINVIQALLFMGRDRITPDVTEICARALSAAERDQLRKLAPQAPAWLLPILHEISTTEIPLPDTADHRTITPEPA